MSEIKESLFVYCSHCEEVIAMCYEEEIAQAIKVLYDVEDSRRKMRLYGDVLVAKAEELIYASESAYSAGTIDFLSLIDAQRMLLKYTLDNERAITNYQQKLAELEMLIGSQL